MSNEVTKGINLELYDRLNELLNGGGGGTLDNDEEADYGAVMKFIYDNTFKNLYMYEANPILDITSKFGSVALGFKSFIESGLPMTIIVPSDISGTEEEWPIILRYAKKFPKSNLIIKVATDDFKGEMTRLLGNDEVDMVACDNNYINRVSKTMDKSAAKVSIAMYSFPEAYQYMVSHSNGLEDFRLQD